MAGTDSADAQGHPSLDIVFDQIKARIAVQDAQISALDGKSNFGLASATLLTAGIAALQGAFSKAQNAGGGNNYDLLGLSLAPSTVAQIVYILTTLAFLAYLAVVFTAYQSYRIRDYTVVPQPEPFRDKYMDAPEARTKKVLVDTMVKAFNQNEVLINDKVRWTTRVLLSLMVEAFLLLVITAVRLAL